MTSRSSSLRTSPSGRRQIGLYQSRDHVVARLAAPLLDLTDVVGDREVLGLLGLGRQALLALLAVEADVAPFPELVVVLLGEAEQGRDHHHRKAHAEVLDEVEARFSPTNGSRYSAHSSPDAILEGGDTPGRVGPVDDLAEGVVEGRIHHDHDRERGRIPDGVEGDAAGRAERLGVERRRQDVGEAAQRPKSETFVVVDGRLVAESPPGLVGGFSLVGVVRIPIGPHLGHLGHDSPFRRTRRVSIRRECRAIGESADYRCRWPTPPSVVTIARNIPKALICLTRSAAAALPCAGRAVARASRPASRPACRAAGACALWSRALW